MKTIETGAFSGCDNITQVHAAGNMTELTTMLRRNNVMELILDQVAQTVNAQTIAVESAAIQNTAAAAKQEAIEEGKQVKTEVINIGESTAKETTVEGNVTTEVNDISHPALQGAMAHVVRVITTNADGTKTVKETITSLNDNSYWSESTSTLDALGREVYSEQKAVKTTDDHGKTVTSTSITKVKTQYKNNESKSGIQVQETIFEETGRRMIGAVLLNDNGKRAAETMYSYETRTDEQGNQTEVLVQAKQTVNEFYDNGNMKTSTNTYYTPKDSSVAPELYHDDGSIDENADKINTDNYDFQREEILQFAEQGGPPTVAGGGEGGGAGDTREQPNTENQMNPPTEGQIVQGSETKGDQGSETMGDQGSETKSIQGSEGQTDKPVEAQNETLKMMRKVLLNSDMIEPSSDKIEPSSDKIEPSSDKIEPSSDKIEPSSDKIEPSSDKIEPSSDKIEPSS
ncbi:MAG: hypothetical protein IKF55_02740, partial [Oscillospiraceae bacterium]|nr:hypothetical protein [Oscillospiraceae bacterium]